jgi:hypothetical protein
MELEGHVTDLLLRDGVENSLAAGGDAFSV